MKQYIMMFLLLPLVWGIAEAQEDRFYYYHSNQMTATINTKQVMLSYNATPNFQVLEESLPTGAEITFAGVDNLQAGLEPLEGQEPIAVIYHVVVEFNEASTEANYLILLENLAQLDNVMSINPGYKVGDLDVLTSPYISVELKSSSDFEILEIQADLADLQIVGKDKHMSNWYSLCTKNVTQFSLDKANDLFETNLFNIVEPNFSTTHDIRAAVPTDPDFPSQWAHQNATITTRIQDAWDITTGTNDVTIGVFDTEVEANTLHNDFNASNILPTYDAQYNNPSSANAHGAYVAGIIGATHNNGLSLAGVAPGCLIQPIYHSLSVGSSGLFACTSDCGNDPNIISSCQSLGYNPPYLAGCPAYDDCTSACLNASNISLATDYSTGINWASKHSVDVLNCSWGNLPNVGIVDAAIVNALTLGRDGLGTVVIFCSHNQGITAGYPASLGDPNLVGVDPVLKDMLVIGSISPNGSRSSFSNFGNALDLVAPGDNVLTLNGYVSGTTSVSGTSYAAPYVAGVAALMLSEKPCLTAKEVSDIIEKTAQKVGGYTYGTTPNRPNGDWNNEMGYGLVDAYAAVQEARTHYLQDIDENVSMHGNPVTPVVGTIEYKHRRIEAGANVSLDPTIPIGNYEISDATAEVTMEAEIEVVLKEGFHATSTNGATFDAWTFGSIICNDWVAGRTAATGNSAAHEVKEAQLEDKLTSTLEAVSADLALRIFPNPFKGQTTIEFGLETEGNVSLQLFDLNGRLVKTLETNTALNAGLHQYTLSAEELSAGMYTLRLITKNASENRQLVIMQ